MVGGLFKAFQISYMVNVETGDPFRTGVPVPGPRFWQVVTWYAPEVRRIVKTQATSIAALNLEVVTVDGPVAAVVEVALDEPKDQARVTADRIAVGGKVTAGGLLARVSATLNGAEVFARDLRAAPARELALTFPVVSKDGRNVLVVTAEDAQRGRRQEARVFFRNRPPAAAATPPPVTPPAPAPAPAAPIKLREGSNTIVVRATQTDGTVQQEVHTVTYERPAALGLPEVKKALDSWIAWAR